MRIKIIKSSSNKWYDQYVGCCFDVKDLKCGYYVVIEKGIFNQYTIDFEDAEEVKTEFKLPEKWAVQVTEQNHEVIYKWLDKNNQNRSIDYTTGISDPDKNTKVHHPAYDEKWHQHDIVKPGYQLITFEQFKKYVLEKETMKKDFEIKVINSSLKTYWYTSHIGDTFKVRKADSSIFDYEVIEGKHKGDLLLAKDCLLNNKKIKGYKLIKTYPGSKGLNYFERYTTGKLSNYPEFWEPVYEENLVISIVNFDPFIIKITKDKITISGADVANLEVSPRFLIDLLEDMESNSFPEEPNYRITFPVVKIGCSLFTIEIIQKVVNEYNKLNGLGFH